LRADANAEVLSWFGESAAQLRSFACMPLRDAGRQCFGMLALASEDSKRFYPRWVRFISRAWASC